MNVQTYSKWLDNLACSFKALWATNNTHFETISTTYWTEISYTTINYFLWYIFKFSKLILFYFNGVITVSCSTSKYWENFRTFSRSKTSRILNDFSFSHKYSKRVFFTFRSSVISVKLLKFSKSYQFFCRTGHMWP